MRKSTKYYKPKSSEKNAQIHEFFTSNPHPLFRFIFTCSLRMRLSIPANYSFLRPEAAIKERTSRKTAPIPEHLIERIGAGFYDDYNKCTSSAGLLGTGKKLSRKKTYYDTQLRSEDDGKFPIDFPVTASISHEITLFNKRRMIAPVTTWEKPIIHLIRPPSKNWVFT